VALGLAQTVGLNHAGEIDVEQLVDHDNPFREWHFCALSSSAHEVVGHIGRYAYFRPAPA
jgi:hypothetical protein